jgi:hypothetical protein
VKLYICWGLFRTPIPPGRWVEHHGKRSYSVCGGLLKTEIPGHPCRNAWDALRAAGHEPQVIRSHGWGLLPAALNRSPGRRLARQLTGRSWLPLLITDEGEAISGSVAITQWAATHPRRPSELAA